MGLRSTVWPISRKARPVDTSPSSPAVPVNQTRLSLDSKIIERYNDFLTSSQLGDKVGYPFL
jgi:hypothetical protein